MTKASGNWQERTRNPNTVDGPRPPSPLSLFRVRDIGLAATSHSAVIRPKPAEIVEHESLGIHRPGPCSFGAFHGLSAFLSSAATSDQNARHSLRSGSGSLASSFSSRTPA